MDTCADRVRWDYTQMIGSTGSSPASAELRAEIAMGLAHRYTVELIAAIGAGDFESGLESAHCASEVLAQRRLLEPYLDSPD